MSQLVSSVIPITVRIIVPTLLYWGFYEQTADFKDNLNVSVLHKKLEFVGNLISKKTLKITKCNVLIKEL